MTVEQFTNFGTTTLNTGGGINSSVTSITVTSATTFPSVANYRIVIDSEIMLVTAGAGTTTWTVTRGYESTTAASHSNGVAINHVLTSGSLQTFRSDTNSFGTYANLPTAGFAGRIYKCTDTPYWFMDNGSSWQAFYNDIAAYQLTTGSWSFVNQQSSTFTNVVGVPTWTIPFNSTTNRLWLTKSLANSTPYTITACLRSFSNTPADYGLGISDGTKQITIGYTQANGWVVFKYTNGTTFSAHYATSATYHWTLDVASPATSPDLYTSIGAYGLMWFRIQDDGTNLNYFFSSDGRSFIQALQTTRTDFLTATQVTLMGYPTTSGVGTNSQNSPNTISVYSFQETNP